MNICDMTTTDKLWEVACNLTLWNKDRAYFEVESCWADLGAGLMWETVIAYKGDSHWQTIYPREMRAIISATTKEELDTVTSSIMEHNNGLINWMSETERKEA